MKIDLSIDKNSLYIAIIFVFIIIIFTIIQYGTSSGGKALIIFLCILSILFVVGFKNSKIESVISGCGHKNCGKTKCIYTKDTLITPIPLNGCLNTNLSSDEQNDCDPLYECDPTETRQDIYVDMDPHVANPWGTNQKYTRCYKPVSYELNNCDMYARGNIDEMMARQGRQRNNEKRVIDGAVSKTANYYRKHFADELDIEEKKRWWGNNEY